MVKGGEGGGGRVGRGEGKANNMTSTTKASFTKGSLEKVLLNIAVVAVVGCR